MLLVVKAKDMKWIKKIFFDELEADYLFDNGFHFKSWTEKTWIKKSLSNDDAVKQEISWLERKNYTACMRIRRNGIEIWK